MPKSTSQPAKVLIRKATETDAAAIVQVNYDAVHVTAARDYDTTTIADWSYSVTNDGVKRIEARIGNNPENTNMLVAEINGDVVGFGEIDPSDKELRALYVSPAAGRKGVGRALLQELETAARKQGVPDLWLHSSLTAESFYLANGYLSDGRGEHQLQSGRKMICIKMHKKLG